jgi:hypothetical protein
MEVKKYKDFIDDVENTMNMKNESTIDGDIRVEKTEISEDIRKAMQNIGLDLTKNPSKVIYLI